MASIVKKREVSETRTRTSTLGPFLTIDHNPGLPGDSKKNVQLLTNFIFNSEGGFL